MKDSFAQERTPGSAAESGGAGNSAARGEEARRRQIPIYARNNDIRSEFERDYTRLLHCQAFRRLKHKTQVFFAPKNDHTCTRMEHVLHVESVAGTIARYLGLNDSLTSAIAIGHDIGHPPFGHHGEDCLNRILQEDGEQENGGKSAGGKKFWHERNSLFFADYIETLPDPQGNEKPLNLTYAVRDGLICHCGEIDQQGIRPRTEAGGLYRIKKPGSVQPYTWEGCVVKTADKIAYLGRDLEDARLYRILDIKAHRRLKEITGDCLRRTGKNGAGKTTVNTTVLINDLIVDLCRQSSPQDGLCFSPEYFQFVLELKKFSFQYIYSHWRLLEFQNYAAGILRTIWHTLLKAYPFVKSGRAQQVLQPYPNLCGTFTEWLEKYTAYVPHVPGRPAAEDRARGKQDAGTTGNRRPVFDIADGRSYRKCVIEYISGMTDLFAIQVFGEIISF